MLKPTVTRNLMLDFIQGNFVYSGKILPERISKLNKNEIQKGVIVYLMTREFRLEDNWGLLFALELAQNQGKKLKILADINEIAPSDRQKEFFEKRRNFLEKNFAANKLDFEICDGFWQKKLKNIGALVVDFNPPHLKQDFAQTVDYPVFEVDSHNIVPARFISDKQEFSAATLRRKIYSNISNFLTEFPVIFKTEESEASLKMKDFIKHKLKNYAEMKNDPNKNMTSNLSPDLHFGLISSQRIALEIVKSNTSKHDKESFLEELIVRKELSDNFCLYNKNYNNLKGTPDWAKQTFKESKQDIRVYIYNLKEFEQAKTHDELWNASQKQLLEEGKIHGYMRMYWAKKILEWSASAADALKIAIYLNDKYALDGNDPNGYVGIMWSICGVHDRAFSPRPIFGKIRYMSYQGCKNKFDVEKYIKNYQ